MGLKSIVSGAQNFLHPTILINCQYTTPLCSPIKFTTLHSDFRVVLITSSFGLVFTTLFPSLHSSHPFHVALLFIYSTKLAIYPLFCSSSPWVSGSTKWPLYGALCMQRTQVQREFSFIPFCSPPPSLK